MQIREYITKYDSLASEDTLFEIPLRKEYVLSKIGRGKRVLDVGCLGGKISQLIMNEGNEVWGVEVNPVAAAQAQLKGIRVKVADVEDGLPFEDGFFDFVNAGEIVEHLYDTKFFFKESYRVLKKNGVLLFTTPNLNSLENRVRVMFGGYLSMIGAYPEDHFGDHIRVLNHKKIQELCNQTSFELLDLSGVPYIQSGGEFLDHLSKKMGKAFPNFSKLLMVTAKKV